MIKMIKRCLACFLIAILLVGMTSFTSAEAALRTPSNCRFDKWMNEDFTSCRIKWSGVSGANRYTLALTYKDGSHYKQYTTSSTSYTLKGLKDDQIYIVKVMASYVDPATGATTNTSNYSKGAFIVPMPTELSMTVTNKDKIQVKLKWNTIHGSSGYNVFLSTNPSDEDSWRWDQSTSKKASATSATVKKFRGSKFKTYKNYYVRIVTRRRSSEGDFYPVPVPDDYYNGGFRVTHIR